MSRIPIIAVMTALLAFFLCDVPPAGAGNRAFTLKKISKIAAPTKLKKRVSGESPIKRHQPASHVPNCVSPPDEPQPFVELRIRDRSIDMDLSGNGIFSSVNKKVFGVRSNARCNVSLKPCHSVHIPGLGTVGSAKNDRSRKDLGYMALVSNSTGSSCSFQGKESSEMTFDIITRTSAHWTKDRSLADPGIYRGKISILTSVIGF